MFKAKRFMFAALAMAALTGIAQAGTISSSETSKGQTTWGNPYEFTYNLTGAKDFKANSNFFTAADLGITMTGGSKKNYSFALGHEESLWFLTWFEDAQDVTYNGKGEITQSFKLNGDALADLNADGKISIFFQPGLFEKMKIDSTLTATYKDAPVIDPTPPTNDVPEPASLALMGVGMLGLATLRKRKQRA